MTTVTVIPFDDGQHQGVSKNLLPNGQFALVQNGQLARDGQLRTRPGYTSLGTTTYGSGSFTGYDLYSYNDRLLALGDRLSKGFPTDVFEYTQGVGAAVWKPTDPSGTGGGGIRLPRATHVRDMGSPPEQEGTVLDCSCAAGNGYTTLVYNTSVTTNGFAHIFNPATDQTLHFRRFDGTSSEPRFNLQAVALSGKVFVLGLTTATTSISGMSFTYTSSESFSGLVTNLQSGNPIISYHAVKVSGSDQFVITAVFLNGDVVTRRYDNTGTVITPSGGQYSTKSYAAFAVRSVAVEADSASNRIVVAVVDSGLTNLYVYNLTTGADVGAGPFIPIGQSSSGLTGQKVALTRMSSATVMVLTDGDNSDTVNEPSIILDEFAHDTGSFGITDIIRDAQMASYPVVHADEVVVAIKYVEFAKLHIGPNLLVSIDPNYNIFIGTGLNTVTPQISKDLEIAHYPTQLRISGFMPPPAISLDSSTGKYYWSNCIINTGEVRPGDVNASVDGHPVVTEFLLGSSDRRQGAQLGNLLYISGGCPVFFDGRQSFETGFHARPRIIGVTPEEDLGGALIPQAEYDYRLIWEALDSDRNLTRSAVSSTFTIKMEAASITGVTNINPVQDLDGLTLVFRDDQGTISTVTFTTEITEQDIIDKINTDITVDIEASASDGHNLVLTATGTNTLVEIVSNSTALGVLGLTAKRVFGAEPGTFPTQNRLLVSTPHSLRNNSGVINSGSSTRIKVYRTQATSSKTSAELIGQTSIDPPATSLAFTQIILFVEDSVGSALLPISFVATDDTAAEVISRINTGTGGRIVASLEGTLLKLTSKEQGDHVKIYVNGGLAAPVLGFPGGTSFIASGTTTTTKGENFQFCATSYISTSERPGTYVEITDVLDDVTLASQEVLYTSLLSDKSHHAPPPHDYVWAGRERLVTAGQPKADRWTVSKLLNPFESCVFAPEGDIGFNGRTSGNLEASVVEGEDMVFLTRRKIWGVSGRGPERNGQGEFFAAGEITSKGLKVDGWKSLCKCDEGVFFQLGDDKLYIMRSGGTPEWIGQPVRDTLAANPVITAAVYCPLREAVVFACQNTAGSTGTLLVYDLRRQVWSQDEVGVVDSVADFNGRIVYLQNGTVFIEDTTAGVGTYVPMTVTTGSFTGFGPTGWGNIQRVCLLGTYQGDCNLQAEISYNDGRTWTTLGTFAVTAANGYTANDPVQLEFVPAIQECSRFALRFSETFAGSNSQGTWLNALELHHSLPNGPNRLGSSFSR